MHLIVGDLIAPPQLQTDAVAEEAQRRLYGWLAATTGPQTLVLITPISVPGPQVPGRSLPFAGHLLRNGATAADELHYRHRLDRAEELAKAAGLHYAHQKRDFEEFTCHACGGVLLRLLGPLRHCEPCIMPTHYCPWWRHEQYVTAGRCDHCGAAVPIQTLTPAELDRVRAVVTRTTAGAQYGTIATPPLWPQRDGSYRPQAVAERLANVEETAP